MVTQEDTIFVSGMNDVTTEQDIATHFGAIGIIKVGAPSCTIECCGLIFVLGICRKTKRR